MPGKAPVDAVGGNRERGPWPKDVDEIVEGKQYDRPVQLDDGTVEVRTVTVKKVEQIVRPDGTETDGYIVSFTHGGGV